MKTTDATSTQAPQYTPSEIEGFKPKTVTVTVTTSTTPSPHQDGVDDAPTIEVHDHRPVGHGTIFGYLCDGDPTVKMPASKDPKAWTEYLSKAPYANIEKAIRNGDIPAEVLQDPQAMQMISMRAQTYNRMLGFVSSFLNAEHETKKAAMSIRV
jgi:hypothetical protein